MSKDIRRYLLLVSTFAFVAEAALPLAHGESAFDQARQAAGVEFVAPAAVRPSAVRVERSVDRAVDDAHSVDPRILSVKITEYRVSTPRGKMLVAEVTAAVCRTGFPTVNPTVSRIANDVARLDLRVQATCSNSQASFALPLDGELMDLGFDLATVKIQWNGHVVWPSPQPLP